jgi:hypothetical protein
VYNYRTEFPSASPIYQKASHFHPYVAEQTHEKDINGTATLRLVSESARPGITKHIKRLGEKFERPPKNWCPRRVRQRTPGGWCCRNARPVTAEPFATTRGPTMVMTARPRRLMAPLSHHESLDRSVEVSALTYLK